MYEIQNLDKNNKEEKNNKIDERTALIHKIVAILSAITAGVCIYSFTKLRHRPKREYSKIVVDNQNIYFYDNLVEEGTNIISICRYKVDVVDEKTWNIYVYTPLNKQELYARYLASKLYFNEDGSIFLDSDSLTGEGFYEFTKNLDEFEKGKSRRRNI